MTDLFEIEMRKVRHLVGGHHAIDDRRTIDLERRVDLGAQLVGIRRFESMAAASQRERGEIRVGKLDALPVRRQACAFGCLLYTSRCV